MNYTGIDSHTFVLAHALTGARRNGKERANHKYIKREWGNGRWVYTYANDNKNMRISNKANKTITKKGNGKQTREEKQEQENNENLAYYNKNIAKSSGRKAYDVDELPDAYDEYYSDKYARLCVSKD